MLGAEQAAATAGDSPKRRSTFYVSLDDEAGRQQAGKFQKSVSCDSDRYACTYPIATSKTAPNVPLLMRAQSTSNESSYGGKREGTLEPRGKVQSLTRIFETPKNNNNNKSSNINNNVVESEQRKKVERTRSFKTIERFQNRFTGKKESNGNSRKDTRLNKSLGTFETDKNNVEKEEMENRRRSKHEEVVERRTTTAQSKISSKSRSRDQAKSVVEPRVGKPAQNSSTNGVTLANLIRRTHSTKLARSTSTLVRSGRHASIDSCNLTQTSCAKEAKNEEVDSGQENEEVAEEAVRGGETTGSTGCEETDTDAGVHSGDRSGGFLEGFCGLRKSRGKINVLARFVA